MFANINDDDVDLHGSLQKAMVLEHDLRPRPRAPVINVAKHTVTVHGTMAEAYDGWLQVCASSVDQPCTLMSNVLARGRDMCVCVCVCVCVWSVITAPVRRI